MASTMDRQTPLTSHPMPFDRDQATQIVKSLDRDMALFFEGCEAEIQAFDDAVREASQYDQATFRIFQGPPGCGKTSLAHHLTEIRSENVLFVPCEPDDLRNAANLSDRIERSAIERGGTFSRAVAIAAETAGERLGARPLADAALRAVAGFTSGGATVVLHLDESHARAPTVGERLVALHTTGIGVPCVVMMTGLGHTSLCVAGVHGLSRLASNAVVDMGPMEARECAGSTAKMLDALKVSGDAMEKNSIARLTADLAHKWPQHLHCAQTALCEELLRTDGVLREVDADRLQARSDELRHAYYRSRLEDPIFKIDSDVTKRILVTISTTQPPINTRWQLRKLCEAVIDSAGLSGEPEFRELPRGAFSTALIEKGVVSDVGGKWAVSIPSMVNWAAKELAELEGGSRTPHRRVGKGEGLSR